MSEHPKIRAVSFTGSTQTGRAISQAAAPHFKKLSLEMGGKNATLIFKDCAIEHALEETIRSAFLNQGQICLCGSRIFIERPLYESLKLKLIERTKALKLGNPLDGTTEQGAIVSKPQIEKVLYYLDLAQKEGGKILCGGKQAILPSPCASGWFIEPTLIENLSPSCRTNQEEIFGPVATLIPFDTEEEVIAGTNATRYGLAASVWTQDLNRAHRVSGQLEVGMVWINSWMVRDLRTPFGGVKESGLGREGGFEALRFFSDSKNVCIRTQSLA